MGEIADDMINGFYCELCGVMIDGEEPGYPRMCKSCKKEDEELNAFLDMEGFK